MGYDDEWEKQHPRDCCCGTLANPNEYCPIHADADRFTSICVAIIICLMAVGLLCALPWIA